MGRGPLFRNGFPHTCRLGSRVWDAPEHKEASSIPVEQEELQQRSPLLEIPLFNFLEKVIQWSLTHLCIIMDAILKIHKLSHLNSIFAKFSFYKDYPVRSSFSSHFYILIANLKKYFVITGVFLCCAKPEMLLSPLLLTLILREVWCGRRFLSMLINAGIIKKQNVYFMKQDGRTWENTRHRYSKLATWSPQRDWKMGWNTL